MTIAQHPKKTPLHAIHVAAGARMMPFAGFDMPVQYSSIIEEHKTVREAAGLFDVSHMGEVFVLGPQALAFVQHLVTNDISHLHNGQALYTVMCNPDGGIIDDLLVYRLSETAFMLVINASNIEGDVDWMQHNNPMGATLEDISGQVALLALQGPAAPGIVQALTNQPIDDLKYYHFVKMPEGHFLGCQRAILSRTGYTGEVGFEIYCEAEKAETVWTALLEAGTPYGLKPIGLGARDTLRLEAGFCLYGNDITERTNPFEAGLGWLVKLDKGDFIGREALQQVKQNGPKRKLVGFVMNERGIPRHTYPILDPNGHPIGEVTSGSQSPILNQGIGRGYVPNEPAFTQPGCQLTISVRGRPLSATVKKPPFHKD